MADELASFPTDGYAVLRRAFDPAPLAAEADAALARGFTHGGHRNTGDAENAFRYVPMMGERTPVSLALLHRFEPLAAGALGGPVLPVRAKVTEYHTGSSWHRDSDGPVPSAGFVCYLEPLAADTGALRVAPGSHTHDDPPGSTGVPVETEPGDAILFDEHLLHASDGGGVRRQWRVDFVRAPEGPDEVAALRRYYAANYSPDWDGGYDVEAFPSYGPHWRAQCDPATDAALDALGAYAAAAAEEDAAQRRAGGELLARLGGEDGIRTLVAAWYPQVLADPLLVPLFGEGDPRHVDHLTALLAEVFGGPARYSGELGGFPSLPAHHRGLRIAEPQRARFVELFLAAYDAVRPPDDMTRRHFAEYLAFGTEVAVVNSHAESDGDLHPCQEIPHWP
jgi:hemoglobin